MNVHVPTKRSPARGGRPRPADGMRYRAGMLHPEEAAQLARNMDDADTGSKPFRDKVSGYADLMRQGRWRANGETVVIGTSGKVLDGRARLLAIVEAGVPVPMIVVTDVDDAVYVTIDAHSKRSAADILSIDEVVHARVVASAWQAIASYLNTDRRDRWRYHGKAAVTPQDIALLTEAFREDMDASSSFVVGLRIGKLVPNTVAVACHFLASKADPELANAFFREMAQSAPRGRGAPAVLRRRFEDEASNTTFTYRMAVFSKAWAAYSDKRNPTYAEIDFRGPVERKGNLGDEAFPPIRGIDPALRIDFGRLRKAEARSQGPGAASAYDGVTVREVDVTVDLCREYLAQNGPKGRNRSIRPGHVRDLARVMKHRHWLPNGKTIKRTSNGDLLDGQHRCRAGIAADTGFRSLVVEGLDPDCFVTLDLGQRKTLGARIRAGGDKSGTQINSVCTIFWRIAHGLVGGEPTAVEAERIYLNDKEAIDRSVAFAKCNKMRDTLDVSIAAAMHRAFCMHDEALADAFVTTLATGYMLDAGNPIHKLREELKRKNGSLDSHVRKVRAVMRTWNAYVTNQKPRDLQLVVEGETKYPALLDPAPDAPRAARKA